VAISGDPREIPFDFAQGRLSLRLKNGSARDDAVGAENLEGRVGLRGSWRTV